jgi:hypothetical protein
MLFKAYKVQYLVLSEDSEFKRFKERYAGKLMSGPLEFVNASRNPFNRQRYAAAIYRIRQSSDSLN